MGCLRRCAAFLLLAWAAGPALRPALAQDAAASIVDLQADRQSVSLDMASGGHATLTNLNPRIGVWYLLVLQRNGQTRSYHLENPAPRSNEIHMDPQGLLIVGKGQSDRCLLWQNGGGALEAAQRSGEPYAALCEARLYLRNAAIGSYTRLEQATNFLRDHVWGGERIISFVRDQFYQDAFLEHATPSAVAVGGGPGPGEARPQAAQMAARDAGAVEPGDLALDLGRGVRSLVLGQWYPLQGADGIYLSAVQAQAVAPQVEPRLRGRVEDLDGVETSALDYLVAFDLKRFDLGFALGTDHPRLGWSERVLDSMRVAGLPGPDGIDSDAPLARTGMVSPAWSPAVVATFTGGFKREHGAFRYGPLAYRNRGSHYGFIEEGVLFSRLQPGLATLYVLDDGSIGMKTWDAADTPMLPRIRYARQNGVALIDQDPLSGMPQPAPLVSQWGPGNWSGSKDERFRTLRAGVCLSGAPGRKFLVYGYFSSATPRAMARVFQAYGCSYAMHLDMNALEHTYLAVYTQSGQKRLVQHLIQGMEEVDKKGGDRFAPRFLSFPDDRDFFYLMRRGGQP